MFSSTNVWPELSTSALLWVSDHKCTLIGLNPIDFTLFKAIHFLFLISLYLCNTYPFIPLSFSILYPPGTVSLSRYISVALYCPFLSLPVYHPHLYLCLYPFLCTYVFIDLSTIPISRLFLSVLVPTFSQSFI